MPHIDYLGGLPEELQRKLSAVTGNFSKDWEIVNWLAEEAERQIDNRHEISVSLLDGFDLIEIAVQKSMVPSQKSEFAWHVYCQFFRVFVKLVQAAESDPTHDGNEETLPFLLAKLRWEMKRRDPVLRKGSHQVFRQILNPIRHLL